MKPQIVVERVEPAPCPGRSGLIQTVIVGQIWQAGAWHRQTTTMHLTTGQIAFYKGMIPAKRKAA